MHPIEEKIDRLVRAVRAGEIKKSEAILAVTSEEMNLFCHPQIARQGDERMFADHLLADSPGTSSGIAVFDMKEAAARTARGEQVILIRPETGAEDTAIMKKCAGVVTLGGGRTSHSKVVSRGAGIPCVSSPEMRIAQGQLICGEQIIEAGAHITIDGTSGAIYHGEVPSYTLMPTKALNTLLSWSDEIARIKTYVILDSKEELEKALREGAKGISILRTEHMFFAPERLAVFQSLLLTPKDKPEWRAPMLVELQEAQRQDFTEIFASAMKSQQDFPVNIRLLDPPQHEFMPQPAHWDEFLERSHLGIDRAELAERIGRLKEKNPMFGKRGVRLLLDQPDLMRMQLRAIFEAAAATRSKFGQAPNLGICIPMTENAQQLKDCREIIQGARAQVAQELGLSPADLPYFYSTMIETPAAAINAENLAKLCDSFNFGGHDMAASVHAADRDSCDHPEIFAALSDETLYMAKIAASGGKAGNRRLNFAFCGDQGRDPDSLTRILSEIKQVDSVTANAHDVMRTRLIAAQATIKARGHALSINRTTGPSLL